MPASSAPLSAAAPDAVSVASDPVDVRPVRSAQDMSLFIRLPRVLYRGLPGYQAPLDFERRQLLDPKHSKFFDHGEAQYWVAYRGERAVGRISAQVDRLAIETWGEPIGCFGCLDAADDPAAVAALCETAAAWLRARGMTRMRGPFTLSINGESGVQVEGQERGGMVLMPWHPSYLARHVEAAGLAPVKDLLAFTLHADGFIGLKDRAALARSRLPAGLALRKINLKDIQQEGAILRHVFNEAWKKNWSFVPFSESEMTAFTKGFRHFLIPEFGLVAELDGKPVAVAVVLPNLFEVVGGFDGRLLPFNWMTFLARAFRVRAYRHLRVVLFGVVPQLHLIGAPLVLAMLEDLFERQKTLRVEGIEMSWVLEDNRAVIGLLAAAGARQPSKRYRMYERAL
ncbi:MAG: hypothetical protein IT538_13315 [Variibacter sp.]|nr:hypothetical protein [Variibacter sp.]